MRHRKFAELESRMSPASKARSDAKHKKLVEAVPLAEVRKARELTQQQLAKRLGVNQGEISKMEHRTDMYVSTLRSLLEAMGGGLEVRAVFRDGREFLISQFHDVPR